MRGDRSGRPPRDAGVSGAKGRTGDDAPGWGEGRGRVPDGVWGAAPAEFFREGAFSEMQRIAAWEPPEVLFPVQTHEPAGRFNRRMGTEERGQRAEDRGTLLDRMTEFTGWKIRAMESC